MKSSSRARERAFSLQNGFCYYCGLPMGPSAEWPHRLACTAEHLVARSDGGGNGPENIVAAHSFCNRVRHARKHPMSPTKYKQHVQGRVAAGRWFRV
jgi:5-methylcytosine-specific restriction endonuclease McrA